ncbi:hypothetical protein BpHYR1_004232 [Brachionus plicatilis]|uniref:Uncharacterized protein n=1 Tax=Brachionus plicatilis TaxID=10195 RepID=A0A3M7QBZ2_BRAPC|nr:hypothetical protein BpHYR1_004232 [Brachionus plicatilis]
MQPMSSSDLFSHNAFYLVQNCQVELELKTDKSIKSVRQGANEMSIGGGQGMIITIFIYLFIQLMPILVILNQSQLNQKAYLLA